MGLAVVQGHIAAGDRSCYDPKKPVVTLRNGDGPATYAGASRVWVARARACAVRGDSVSAGDPERWQLGPVQESVANPVRSGRKQRYRQSLCVAGVPSCRRWGSPGWNVREREWPVSAVHARAWWRTRRS